jgi:hypothetical protein
MDEASTVMRGIFAQRDSGQSTLDRAEALSSGESASAKPTAEQGLLSRETTEAVSFAVNKLAESVKKHEPTLEEVAREVIRPMLKSWIDENLHDVVERIVRRKSSGLFADANGRGASAEGRSNASGKNLRVALQSSQSILWASNVDAPAAARRIEKWTKG